MLNRKICSWDVGIKHLAYCIINVKNDGFKIEKWENIDLTEDEKFKCSGLLKKNKLDQSEKVCGAGAKYFREMNNEIKYYCGIHKSQYKINFDEIENKMIEKYNNQSKEKCQNISKKTQIQCIKKGEYKINDMIYCKGHKEQKLKEKIKEISIKPIKKIKCTSIDPQKLCEKLYKKLKNINEFKQVNEIYIENQPTFINPTMKAVSSMLFAYFIYLFNESNFNDRIVKFVSPSVKIEITEELINFINDKN